MAEWKFLVNPCNHSVFSRNDIERDGEMEDTEVSLLCFVCFALFFFASMKKYEEIGGISLVLNLFTGVSLPEEDLRRSKK